MFDKNSSYSTELPHVDGVHDLEIAFSMRYSPSSGSSFTLRMTEDQVDNLRDILYNAARHMGLVRPVHTDVVQETLPSQPRSWEEDVFIEEGIRAREQQKLDRMMQGTASPITNDPIDW